MDNATSIVAFQRTEEHHVINLSKLLAEAGLGPDGFKTDPLNHENLFVKLVQDPQIQEYIDRYLSPQDSSNVRRSSKLLWNNYGIKYVQLVFDEKKKDLKKEKEKLQYFLSETSVGKYVQNFRLNNVHFTGDKLNEPKVEFVGNQFYLDMLISKYGSTLRSLHLYDCDLPKTTFMKLVAYFPKLQDLQLMRCNPKLLFIAGLQTLDYYSYMKKCRENLANLKIFAFEDIEPKQVTKVGGIDWILGATNKLELLHINKLYGPTPFPQKSFVNILVSNKSLKQVQLVEFDLDDEILQLLSKVQLPSLNKLGLFRCGIRNVANFGKFLAKQENLETLVLEYIDLKGPIFPPTCKIPEKLWSIHLRGCSLSIISLITLKKMNFTSATRLEFIGSESCSEAVRIFLQRVNPNPTTHLAIQIVDDRTVSKSLEYIGNNFPNLRYLNISGMLVGEGTLKHLWKLVTLQVLIMPCVNVTEEDFDDRLGLDMTQLKELVNLDLTNTDVNDSIVKKHISHLGKLEHLALGSTEITVKSMKSLLGDLQLKYLDIRECNISFTIKQYEDLSLFIPTNATFLCNIGENGLPNAVDQNDFDKLHAEIAHHQIKDQIDLEMLDEDFTHVEGDPYFVDDEDNDDDDDDDLPSDVQNMFS